MRLRIRVSASRFEESPPNVPPLTTKKGGGAPTGAPRVPPRRSKKSLPAYAASTIASSRERCGIKAAAPSPSAPHRGHASRALPQLGSGPRFLESPDPNGRTLSGASAASTWQSGHAPDGRCPEPPGSRLQAPSGNRARPIDRLSPVDVPSMDELGYVTVLGTTVKTCPQSRDSVVLERRGAIHRSALVVSSG